MQVARTDVRQRNTGRTGLHLWLHRLLLAGAGAGALGLAGCETVGSITPPGTGIAEVQAASKDTSVNIASLTDVINRNPNDSDAYNTRGTAYARTGRRAATTSRWPISTRRSRPTPPTRPRTSAAATCFARKATSNRP